MSSPVVLGVLIEEGRILLGQRKRVAPLPWRWGCPGGKVEDGETDAAALAREWYEELGVRVSVGPLVGECVLPLYSVKHYRVYLEEPTPRPKNFAEEGIGWFTVDEIRRLNKVPSLTDEILSTFEVILTCLPGHAQSLLRRW